MPKYRQTPVVVDAVQWSGQWEDIPAIIHFTGGQAVERSDMDNKRSYLMINTLQGDLIISPHDFVIRGTDGEYYPRKPDIFKQTHERVE